MRSRPDGQAQAQGIRQSLQLVTAVGGNVVRGGRNSPSLRHNLGKGYCTRTAGLHVTQLQLGS